MSNPALNYTTPPKILHNTRKVGTLTIIQKLFDKIKNDLNFHGCLSYEMFRDKKVCLLRKSHLINYA